MAAYDLEEQEKIDDLKAWWNQYGNTIAVGVILACVVIGGVQGWRWWAGRRAAEASVLYQAVSDGARKNDPAKVKDAMTQLADKFGGTAYAPRGALLYAKVLFDAGDKMLCDVARADGALLARFPQRLDRDAFICGFVVADDQRITRAARVGSLHLRLEGAAAGVDDDRMPDIAKRFSDPMREPRGGVADVDDIGQRRVLGLTLLELQQQDHPLDAHPKAAGRRGLASECFEQPIVASAAGDRSLRAETIGNPLEHRAIVVIETANEPRIDRERNAGIGKQSLHAFEVLLRSGLQAIDEARCARDDVLQRRILAVQNPQRIGREPPLRVRIERVRMTREVVDQRSAMRASFAGVADRVDLEANSVGEPQLAP